MDCLHPTFSSLGSQLDVGEAIPDSDQVENDPLSSSSNTSLTNVPKAIPSNEADMICTTIENVSHVRFEWTVEDFYPHT